jgi:hypothetical protein
LDEEEAVANYNVEATLSLKMSFNYAVDAPRRAKPTNSKTTPSANTATDNASKQNSSDSNNSNEN